MRIFRISKYYIHMKKGTILMVFFSVIAVLCGMMLRLFFKNKLNNNTVSKYGENNKPSEEYIKNENVTHEWTFEHWEEEYIKKYDIQCDEGTHIDSFYHDSSRRGGSIPIEELNTLDIYCVDENNIKNWIYYTFRSQDIMLQQWYFLNWKMDWERISYVYNTVANYKDWKRNWMFTWYNADWTIRYTWLYINGKELSGTQYVYENWNISSIRIYSNGYLVKEENFMDMEK